MSEAKKDFIYTMTSGQIIPFYFGGDTYAVLEADSAVYLAFEDSNEFVKASQGVVEKVGPYEKVRVKSLVAQNVHIKFGYGDIAFFQ